MEELGKEIKCRDSIVEQLYKLLVDDIQLQSIFIYGHVSCAKTFILQKLLNYLGRTNGHRSCFVNCLEHVTTKSLLEKIIIDLSGIELTAANGYKLAKRCEDLVDFISEIKKIANGESAPIIIVFERCEKLRDMDANLLPALLRLQELTRLLNLCTIFVSDIVWEKFRPKIGMYEPVRIHIPQYTKIELQELLCYLTKPEEYDDEFYMTYISLFLSIYYRFCRDVNELCYMAKKNFVKYCEPVENGTIESTNTNGLWLNAQKTLKSNLEVIYLRVSADDFEQQSELSREIESTTKLALSFDLPAYAKFLLIAAYIASYNPPAEDKRIFMRDMGQKKRRKKSANKRLKDKVSLMREGPKSFPLRRMFAIFCAISDEPMDMNAILLTQVPSMCKLGLLSLVGDNNIDEPKYKCSVNFEFVMVISKTVGFELKKYLYDFLD